MRVAIVHNTDGSLLSYAVQAALQSRLSLPSLLTCLQTLLELPQPIQESSVVDACDDTWSADEMMEQLSSADIKSIITEHTLFSRTIIGLGVGRMLC